MNSCEHGFGMAIASGWSWGSTWGDDGLEEQEDEVRGRVSQYTHAQRWRLRF